MLPCVHTVKHTLAPKPPRMAGYPLTPTPLKKWNPPGLGPPPAFHVNAAEVPPNATQLLISGQTGTELEDGSAIEAAAEQCERAFAKSAAALAAAGMGWGDVVQRTVWLTPDCSEGAAGAAAAGATGGALACATGVVIDALSEGCHFEVEVVAAKTASPPPGPLIAKFSPPGTPDPTPPGLWPVVTVAADTRLLFVSGQVSGAAPAEQAQGIYTQLAEILAEAEMGWGDVTKR